MDAMTPSLIKATCFIVPNKYHTCINPSPHISSHDVQLLTHPKRIRLMTPADPCELTAGSRFVQMNAKGCSMFCMNFTECCASQQLGHMPLGACPLNVYPFKDIEIGVLNYQRRFIAAP